MATMDCKRVTAEDVAEHYLFGRLADADRDAFESHVFECDRCFDDLRTLQAVQAELQSMPPTAALAAARRGWFPVWVAAAAAVALAAALGFRRREHSHRRSDWAGSFVGGPIAACCE
jgi:anti-sigma factor RsiW